MSYCTTDGSVSSAHYSTKMCSDLIKLGCVPRKSLILQFPDIPSSVTRHFVRGYFDGDGCASWHNKKMKVPQLRLSFIGTLCFLTRLKNILKVESGILPKGRAKILQINGNKQAKRIRDWMYQDALIFLDKKKNISFKEFT